MDNDKRIWWGKNGKNVPRIKRFLSEVMDGIVPQSIWLHDEVGHNKKQKKKLWQLFQMPKMYFKLQNQND